MITVRYFAAAAEAAGTATEQLDAGTAGELRAALADRHGAELERVLGRCALLHDGRRLDDPGSPLAAGGVVDVLPPFAGG
ncbi:MoaD/ThiS family protein [Cellulomonas sp.]|uniref:MoaD/ThiS family protein n=1 Tax=Cellulomonas sp. TaxID=40001 RepID=UPI002D46B734|nr:MoaD/ThiS family protein [Cellulomonas sp.]HYQ74352.1 MoaD/ThiS family protein [Cellulomonas sp.]